MGEKNIKNFSDSISMILKLYLNYIKRKITNSLIKNSKIEFENLFLINNYYN
jgi:hypothetical protein